MNIIEQGERFEQEVELLATVLFWTERLFLFLLLVSSEVHTNLIGLVLIFSTLLSLILISLCPKLSGISGFSLFLSDRFMFLLAFKSFGADQYMFLWPLSVFIFIANHSVYIFEYLGRSSKPHNNEGLIPTEGGDETVDVRDVSEEVKKMRHIVKELREDEEKMEKETEFLEHIVSSRLENHRKNLSAKLLELREELRDDEEKMRRCRELMKKFIYSELVTLKDYLNLNVDEIWDEVRVYKDIKDSRDNIVESVGDEVCKNYLVIQETAKAAKTTADRANLSYLVTQEIIDEIQNMRWLIKDEEIDEFLELRDEVRRMSLDFEDRKLEAEAIAERAAEELSLVMVELVEAVEFRPWEEYKTD
ncbi:hypothetical protein CARUB_v10025383mg [Capsella rubella]|uniref:Uncharacterized protein n=1 Tax=Capsella rubella TaxID=81985 RepID=R0G1J7_9BRAS|nr:hypothetical protein CARUB_v10025383mg [Capsella rubella]